MAEVGRSIVSVFCQPRVSILTTGNELVGIGEMPGPGQIRNSNGPLLAAAVAKAGGVAIELGVARDEPEELRKFIEQGLEAEMLVLSGGVSAGKFDLVPGILAELGVKQVFHKVAMRPGKPLWFGVYEAGERRVLVFGLPGNPVSSYVCFELFVRPAIAALRGRGFVGLRTARARLKHEFQHSGGRPAYLPAVYWAEAGEIAILPWQGSADLATLAKANCLARLGVERQELRPGVEIGLVEI